MDGYGVGPAMTITCLIRWAWHLMRSKFDVEMQSRSCSSINRIAHEYVFVLELLVL